MADAPPRTLSARTWAVFGVAFAIVVGLLSTQVVLLVQQKALIDHQESIAERQAERTLPLLRTADALLGDGDALRTGARRAGSLVADLRRADLPELADVTVRELQRLPEAVALLHRTVGLLESTHSTLGRSYVTQRRVLARTDTAVDLQRASLAILRRSLAVQEQTLDVARRTMTAAERAATSAESIDRKTGGPVPAGAGGGLLP